jgi:hypothetical protein
MYKDMASAPKNQQETDRRATHQLEIVVSVLYIIRIFLKHNFVQIRLY